MQKNASKGFTLIELVVVIAIIAVLAAVIVPAVGAMMDRSRLSNDNQTATRMTQAIAWVATEEGLDLAHQTPHDIRAMLTRFDDTTFSLLTTSERSAYFYDVDQQRIVAMRYGDVPSDDAAVHHPEALFSSRYLLLTDYGDPVADVVSGIRNNLPMDTLTEIGATSEHAIRLSALIALFDPSHTVYVSHVAWSTNAASHDDVSRWLFAPGLSHIPHYTLPFVMGGIFEVPHAVKTIAAKAFVYDDESVQPAFETIVIDEDHVIRMHDNAMLDSQTREGGVIQAYHTPSWNPLNGTPIITTSGDTTAVDLSQIDPYFRDRIIATDIIQNGNHIDVHFFTNKGFEAVWSDVE